MNRRVFSVVGAVIALLGLIWFLQGASVLPGSVMTGSQFWEAAGVIVLIIGVLIVGASLRHARSS